MNANIYYIIDYSLIPNGKGHSISKNRPFKILVLDIVHQVQVVWRVI